MLFYSLSFFFKSMHDQFSLIPVQGHRDLWRKGRGPHWDRLPGLRRAICRQTTAHSHSLLNPSGSLESTLNLTYICLHCERKPEYPEKNTGRSCKLPCQDENQESSCSEATSINNCFIHCFFNNNNNNNTNLYFYRTFKNTITTYFTLKPLKQPDTKIKIKLIFPVFPIAHSSITIIFQWLHPCGLYKFLMSKGNIKHRAIEEK